MERKNSILISSAEAGSRLLDLVARRFTYRSRKDWQEEFAAGRLHLNGRTAAAGDLLKAGDRLVYVMPPLLEPPAMLHYKVLHEDADLLVVDKPAPLPCHPAGRYFTHTLWALLKTEHGLAEPLFIHRLDRETSGVVLVAKNRQAARQCQTQFARFQVAKHYLVIVEGIFPPGLTNAEGWLVPDPASAIRKKVSFCPGQGNKPAGAQSCSTTFQLLATEGEMSLLAAEPHTGRCHQIRATLRSLGYPVVGDKLYGLDERWFLRLQKDCLTESDRARLRIERQALHAACLRLRHPTTGSALCFTSPPPAPLQAIMPGISKFSI
jgi:RluA family pseudouridine synthase